MAYTIHETTVVLGKPFIPGDMLGSGQTRHQVARELQRLGLLKPLERCPRLPRFQAAIIVCNPGAVNPYMIRHV